MNFNDILPDFIKRKEFIVFVFTGCPGYLTEEWYDFLVSTDPSEAGIIVGALSTATYMLGEMTLKPLFSKKEKREKKEKLIDKAKKTLVLFNKDIKDIEKIVNTSNEGKKNYQSLLYFREELKIKCRNYSVGLIEYSVFEADLEELRADFENDIAKLKAKELAFDMSIAKSNKKNKTKKTQKSLKK